MKIVYGPVSSWRLGKSLGIDLICSEKKICSFDCIYCQLGRQSITTTNRQDFISMDELNKEVIHILKKVSPDVITFSGMGEPTIAKNLDQAIRTLRKITNVPLAILTNSTLMNNKDVIESLFKLDIVVAKLDASNENLFQEINQPADNISFKETIESIKNFKNTYSGRLNIQTMFMNNNINYAKEIANVVSKIEPYEVQINTLLRPCSIKPLTEQQLALMEKEFKDKDLNTISVYTSTKPKTSPLDKMELLKRRRSE